MHIYVYVYGFSCQQLATIISYFRGQANTSEAILCSEPDYFDWFFHYVDRQLAILTQYSISQDKTNKNSEATSLLDFEILSYG